jgi:hypothetical protein
VFDAIGLAACVQYALVYVLADCYGHFQVTRLSAALAHFQI